MGKFTKFEFFLEAGTFNVWGHEWLTRLTDERQLLIQTNMDLGISVQGVFAGQ